jgi:hypothetical protein
VKQGNITIPAKKDLRAMTKVTKNFGLTGPEGKAPEKNKDYPH